MLDEREHLHAETAVLRHATPGHAGGRQLKSVCARRAVQEIANSLWAFAKLQPLNP